MYKNIFKPRKSMLVHLLSLSSNCHLTFSFLFFIASDITFITFSFYLFPFLSISLIYVMTCLNIFSHPSKLVIFYFNPCKKKKVCFILTNFNSFILSLPPISIA